VERFFTALEANGDWLGTTTPSAWLDGHGPVGRVYLPTGSYAEMGEWALPADEAVGFAHAVHGAKAAGRPEARWLRGAIWRNFQVKYREVNDLHKQMLRTSDMVEAMAAGPARDRAVDDLYAGQSNDCYWHGLFGGIYLPDLRVAALSRLIRAEDAALGGSAPSGLLLDLDLDGRPEALLANDGQIVSVKLDEGAGIGRWDIRAAGVPLTAVMRRRPEAYHEKLRAHEAAAAGDGAAATDGTVAADGSSPASIHELVTTKQEGLSERLVYDGYERRSGLVRLLPIGTSSLAFADGSAVDIVDAVSGPWVVESIEARDVVARYEGAGLRITKRIAIGGSRAAPTLSVDVTLINHRSERLDALLGIEFALMLLGGGGNPAAWYEIGGERLAHDGRLDTEAITTLRSANEQLDVAVDSVLDGPADAWIAPIETVSNSEGGFELVYQGSAVLFVRPVGLEPGQSASMGVEHTVTVGSLAPSTATPQRDR
jgi:alpha-amylase